MHELNVEPLAIPSAAVASMPKGRAASPVLGLALGVAFLIAADDASAAVLGGLSTSMGLFAAAAVFLLVKGLQVHLLGGTLSTVGGMLVLAAGAGLLWRSRVVIRNPRFSVAKAVTRVEPAGTAIEAEPVPLPVDIDRNSLIDDLRRQFVDLQAAWDLGAREALRAMTTPDMLEELCAAMLVSSGAPNRTEVVTLHANVVAFEQLESAQMVCVEFSGTIRESAILAAAPFRELWMLTRASDQAGGWRLARQQTLL